MKNHAVHPGKLRLDLLIIIEGAREHAIHFKTTFDTHFQVLYVSIIFHYGDHLECIDL